MLTITEITYQLVIEEARDIFKEVTLVFLLLILKRYFLVEYFPVGKYLFQVNNKDVTTMSMKVVYCLHHLLTLKRYFLNGFVYFYQQPRTVSSFPIIHGMRDISRDI